MERKTWADIVKEYPSQWVGLTDVEWEPDNDATVASAVVKYTGKPKFELTRMMFETKGAVVARHTEPESLFQMGALML